MTKDVFYRTDPTEVVSAKTANWGNGLHWLAIRATDCC